MVLTSVDLIRIHLSLEEHTPGQIPELCIISTVRTPAGVGERDTVSQRCMSSMMLRRVWAMVAIWA